MGVIAPTAKKIWLGKNMLWHSRIKINWVGPFLGPSCGCGEECTVLYWVNTGSESQCPHPHPPVLSLTPLCPPSPPYMCGQQVSSTKSLITTFTTRYSQIGFCHSDSHPLTGVICSACWIKNIEWIWNGDYSWILARVAARNVQEKHNSRIQVIF